MKQAAFNNNQQNIQHSQAINNANALVNKGQQPKKSFAKEMNQLQNANSLVAGEEILPGQEMLAQNQQPLSAESEVKKFRNAIETAFAEQGINYDSLPPEIQEKLAFMQDAIKKEAQKREANQEAHMNAEDMQGKFTTDESTVANASQENQKQITDAVREGNVSDQEQDYDQASERRRQLENWEDLAPRVVEDTKNRAVRIDIPGLPECETIIVKMQGAKVAIQTVGDGKVMEKLQRQEAVLASKLSAHNIALDSLKAFDSNVLNKGRVG